MMQLQFDNKQMYNDEIHIIFFIQWIFRDVYIHTHDIIINIIVTIVNDLIKLNTYRFSSTIIEYIA